MYTKDMNPNKKDNIYGLIIGMKFTGGDIISGGDIICNQKHQICPF